MPVVPMPPRKPIQPPVPPPDPTYIDMAAALMKREGKLQPTPIVDSGKTIIGAPRS